MHRLGYFVKHHSTFLTFLLLMSTSLGLRFSPYFRQKTAALWHASSYVVGSIHSLTQFVRNVPQVKSLNWQLQQENAILHKKLLLHNRIPINQQDPSDTPSLDCIPATVVNNSIIHLKNYITLDKGQLQGLEPGMGVISDKGIVGKVHAVSPHFATVITLLHIDLSVSAQLNPSGALGTVQWSGKDPTQAHLAYIPRHIAVKEGASIATAGYDNLFPKGTCIGHVQEVSLSTGEPFQHIVLKLATDFSILQHVYVVKLPSQTEKEVLEQHTQAFYE